MCPTDPNLLAKYIIAFYVRATGNVVESIDEIPRESLTIILNMRYIDLIAQCVKEDREKNLSLRFLSLRYGVGVRVIRTIVSH